MIKIGYYLGLMLLAVFSCQEEYNAPVTVAVPLNFLALGDSYTIGQGVPSAEAFPARLVASMITMGKTFRPAEVIAKTGWTTRDLINAMQAHAFSRDNYDLVTLLIGVNNQFQGLPIETFATEFEQVLEMALRLAGGKKHRVWVLSIPDYTITPFGRAAAGRQNQEESIDDYNELKKHICQNYGVSFVDITEISRLVNGRPDLLAADGLHPSGKMYDLWVEKIVPEVLQNW